MFQWLIRLFSGRIFSAGQETDTKELIKSDIGKTTKHFQDFIRYYNGERSDITFESEENLLCRYIVQTRRSPFESDEDFKQAQSLLKKNGIDLDLTKSSTKK